MIRMLFAFFLGSLLVNNAFADACQDVWPDATTGASTATLDLPPITATSPLTLPATLTPGEYYYTGFQSNGALSVSGGPSVIIYIDGKLSVQNDLNPGGNPEDLIIVVDGDISITANVEINALLYATGDAKVSANATIVTGSLTALGTVDINRHATVNYDPDAANTVSAGNLCEAYIDPKISWVGARCNVSDSIVVQYSQALNQQDLDFGSVTNAANYQVTDSNGVVQAIESVSYNANPRQAIVKLASSMSSISEYSLSASSVEDIDGRTLTAFNDSYLYSADKNGLIGAYYKNNTGMSGAIDFYRTDSTIDSHWHNYVFWWETPWGASPNFSDTVTEWSTRWKGFLVPEQDGDYEFSTVSDDGVRLYIEDAISPIIENWSNHASFTDRSSALALISGAHYPIQLEYYNGEGCFFGVCWGTDGEIRLRWSNPSVTDQIIPNVNLQTCIEPDTEVVIYSFGLTMPQNASTCEPVGITLSVIGSDGQTYADFTGDVNLKTTSGHGTWSLVSGSGSLIDAVENDGDAIYTFTASDNGSVDLALDNRHADTLKIFVNDGTVSKLSEPIAFADNAILIEQDDGLEWDVVGGRDHQFKVRYVYREEGQTEACDTASYSGSTQLKFHRSNNNWGGASPGIKTSPAGAVTSIGSDVNVAAPIAFNIVNGEASFILETSDVGAFMLEVIDETGIFVNDGEGGAVSIGGSVNVVVRPFGLYLRHEDNRSPVNQNPAAADYNGDAFVKAGETFKGIVTAVLYQAEDDDEVTDGYPDNHDSDAGPNADLSDNSLAPSFGNEGAGAEDVYLTHRLVAPSGGVASSLEGTASISTFTSGTGSTADLYFPEVGIIEITAALDADGYLGTGRSVYGQSGNVGRFYPDQFLVSDNTPTLSNGTGAWSCSFTYQGQNFEFDTVPTFTVTAVNAESPPVTTQNYTGDFRKLTGMVSSYSANEPADSNTSFSSSINTPTVVWSAGVATVGLTNETMSYSRVTTLGNGDVSFASTVTTSLTDADPSDGLGDGDACYLSGATCSNYMVDATGTTIRYGRLMIDNGFGPEDQEILMPYRAEYWSLIGGSNYGFVVNTDDSCSSDSDIVGVTLTSPAAGVPSVTTSATIDDLSSGLGVVTVAVPNAFGQTVINVDGPSWLVFDFDGDGSEEDANATATFGIFGGREPILHLRETYR